MVYTALYMCNRACHKAKQSIFIYYKRVFSTGIYFCSHCESLPCFTFNMNDRLHENVYLHVAIYCR